MGTEVGSFTADQGLKSLQIGNPLLSIFEAVATSQLRNSDDIFTMLRSIALDYAKGDALDRTAADDLISRLGELPASGLINITDTSFTKISTFIFQGTPAPIVGSASINVSDASEFASAGYLYIGRGTQNYEGPIQYTSIDDPTVTGGNYWRINLSTNTLRFHNMGEQVLFAQGGNRVVNPGTVVQTAQGSVTTSIQFKTVYTCTVLDGDTQLLNVLVQAVKPGLGGNIPANAIIGFAQTPFTGAVANNPTIFSNGQPVETDEAFRDRIRKIRASRQLATPLAIQTNALGITSLSENKRVTSASVVMTINEPTVLYIDDGLGYEETAEGIALETLASYAVGGETKFNTSQVPVAKAYSASTLTPPYAIESGMQLSFSVGGVITTHTFDTSSFPNVFAASAYDVASSINRDFNIGWEARTIGNGTGIAISAKTNVNEDVQNVAAPGVDANSIFGFPASRIYTLRLYKNGHLLNKDGQLAQVYSKSFGDWLPLTEDESLEIQVDGVYMNFSSGGNFAPFVNEDFVYADTGYTTLSRNSPEAWAAVFNLKIPGITASVVNDRVVITSNRGRSSKAEVFIIGGTLVSKNMFADGEISVDGISAGKNSDYIFNRNTGEIKLSTPLAVGDELTIGQLHNEAFIETPDIINQTFGEDADYWFSADGSATLIRVSLGASLVLTTTSESWGDRQRFASTGSFRNTQEGDYVIIWDANLETAGFYGAYRISQRDDDWIEIDVPTGDGVASTVTLASAGLGCVRTDQVVQKLTLAYQTGASTNTYTAATVAELVSQLTNITGTVYRTNKVRIRTDSIGNYGDIALVAQNVAAEAIGLEPADFSQNIESHISSVETTQSELCPPAWRRFQLAANGPDLQLSNPLGTPPSNYLVQGIWDDYDTITTYRWGNNRRFVTAIEYVTAPDTIHPRTAPEQGWLDEDRLVLNTPYMFTATDTETVLVDNNSNSKRFPINMWRSVSPTTNVYGTTNAFTDDDLGGQSLAVAFGYNQSGFDFNDFAVHMKARAKFQVIPNTEILWRYFDWGPNGNGNTLTYGNPLSEDQPAGLEISNTGTPAITVTMPSGELLTGYTLPQNYPIGIFSNGPIAGGLYEVYYLISYKIISFQRTANVATVRLEFPFGSTIKHSGLVGIGNTLFNFVTASAAPSGIWDFSAAVESEWVPASGVYDKIVFSNPGADIPLTAGNVGFLYFNSTQTASFADGSDPALFQYYNRLEDGVFGSDATYDRFEGRTATIANQIEVDLSFMFVYYEPPYAGNLSTDTVLFRNLVSPNAFKIFKNAPINAPDLATAINSLDGVVTGTFVGTDPVTTFTGSAAENAGVTPTNVSLSDGINYVRSTTVPVLVSGNYSLTFKDAVSGSLATNADWQNEVVKLVPTTAQNVVDWFNALAVTGLSNVSFITTSRQGHSVQIATKSPGSAGSIEVQGGEANTSTAAISGTATLDGSYASAIVATGDVAGFMTGQYVKVQNAGLLPKAVFNSSTAFTSIDADGTFHSSTAVYTQRTSNSNSLTVSVENHSGFMCYAADGFNDGTYTLASVRQGDWVYIENADSPDPDALAVDVANRGIFRVQAVDASGLAFWIINPNGVDQHLANVKFRFYTPDSMMPGDTFQISTNLLGAQNEGNRTIVDVGAGFTSTTQFTVDITEKAVSPSAVSSGALGANSTLFQVVQSNPLELIKSIVSVVPYGEDDNFTVVKLSPSDMWGSLGESAGTVLSVYNKLNFPLTDNIGIDGYRYNTGLLQEVNQVMYGNLSSPTVYPGVVAAGGNLNIQGSLIKRIQVSVLVRTQLGFAKETVGNQVKNAIAAYINSSPVGKSISLSGVISAAQGVNGVEAIVIISPTYGNGSDLIPVAPSEKALILNTDLDILVSYTGV